MATSYIDHLATPNGTIYELHDTPLREIVNNIHQFNYQVVTNAADTPEDVKWMSGSTEITGTLVAAATTMYKIYLVPSSTTQTSDIYDEYITADKGSGTLRYVWEKFGSISQPDVDNKEPKVASHTFSGTPVRLVTGNIAVPKTPTGSFSGTAATVKVSGTPNGSASGSFSGTPATISVSGTPNGSASGSFTGTAATIKTTGSPNGSVTSAFSGTAATIKVGGTPAGSVGSTFTGANTTFSGSYTPAGSVTLSGGSTTTIKNPTAKTVVTNVVGSTVAGDESIPYYHVNGTTFCLDKIVVTKGDSITTDNVTVKTGNPTGSFSGTAATIKVTGVPNGSVTSTFSGTAATYSGSYTPVGTVGSTFNGSSTTFSGSYTPAGSVGVNFSGSATTFSGSYTPAGSVSVNFSGSATTFSGAYTPAGSITITSAGTENKSTTVSTASGSATYTPSGTVTHNYA